MQAAKASTSSGGDGGRAKRQARGKEVIGSEQEPELHLYCRHMQRAPYNKSSDLLIS